MAAALLSTERLVALTQTIVRIDSQTGREHAFAEWLASFLSDLGLGVTKLPVEEAGDTIVGVLEGNNPGPTMMLNFHLDTFDVFDGWVTDPFDPVLSADASRLVGLGAHDMSVHTFVLPCIGY
jgi:acetylornithine deacetylase/succinyl-diaminopimelate desuccinylase-like protein